MMQSKQNILIDENTIWNSKQNHPELIIQDCVKEFNLSVEQSKKLRFILMNRGVNKWFFARYKFINLKHEIKKLKKENLNDKNIAYIQEKMQNIAKTPRWIEWDVHIHKKMSKNIQKVKIRGKHC